MKQRVGKNNSLPQQLLPRKILQGSLADNNYFNQRLSSLRLFFAFRRCAGWLLGCFLVCVLFLVLFLVELLQTIRRRLARHSDDLQSLSGICVVLFVGRLMHGQRTLYHTGHVLQVGQRIGAFLFLLTMLSVVGKNRPCFLLSKYHHISLLTNKLLQHRCNLLFVALIA